MVKRERPHQVQVRLSATEYAAITELADEVGLSLAEYLRQLLMIEYRRNKDVGV